MNHRIKPPSNILSTYTRKHGHLRTLFVLIACLSMLTLNIRPDIVYADNQSTNTDEYPIPPEIESGNCILMATVELSCMKKTATKNVTLPASPS